MAIFCCDYKNGNDNYGGDSWTIETSGTDAITNGTTTVTSATCDFTGLAGRYVWIGSDASTELYWGIIVSVTDANTIVVSSNIATGSGRHIVVGGAWATVTTGASATRIAAGDTVKIAKSPDPVSIGQNARWTTQPNALTPAISIDSSTNTSPIQVTSRSNHLHETGDVVAIVGHAGNLAANGVWVITKVDATKFTLDGSVGSGVGTCTGYSRLMDHHAVVLTTPVTKEIDNGEREAWTGGTSVTVTRNTSYFQEGSASIRAATGNLGSGQELAYFDLGAQIDYSDFQQISLWVSSSHALAAGDLQIRLYSDSGRTTEVNRLDLPDIAANTNKFSPVTVDNGSALSSTVRAISIWSTVALNTRTFYFDNIIACKDPDEDDAITLTSLISKNSSARGGTEAWYPIKSIRNRVIVLDNFLETIFPTLLGYGVGYDGDSESVALYRRECIRLNASEVTIQQSGSDGSNITFQGGYDPDTDTLNGETHFDSCTCQATGLGVANKSYLTIADLNFVRTAQAIYVSGNGSHVTISATSLCGNNYAIRVLTSYVTVSVDYIWGGYNEGINTNTTGLTHLDISVKLLAGLGLSKTSATNIQGSYSKFTFLKTCCCRNSGPGLSNGKHNVVKFDSIERLGGWGLSFSNVTRHRIFGGPIKNTRGTAPLYIGIPVTSTYFYGLEFSENSNTNSIVVSGVAANQAGGDVSVYFYNSKFEDTSVARMSSPPNDQRLVSIRHQQTANNHLITLSGGTIESDATTRHTASGISWKLSPTSVAQDVNAPIWLPVARVAVNADAQVTAKIWMKKSHATNIDGEFAIRGGQILGVIDEVKEIADDSTDWQEIELTFTPTEAGVVEFEVRAYGGTTESVWVDDFSISQA